WTVGEICTRGYLVMDGYLGDPDATAAAIDADGWLHTGDLGSMDERGYCRIAGRIKEMIIRGGVDIYPRDVEAVLASHGEGAELGDLVAAGVAADVGELAGEQGFGAGRHAADDAAAEPERAGGQATLPADRAAVAEGVQQRVVHQRLGEPGHRGAGREAVRAERGHQPQRGLGHGQAAVVEAEVLAFVAVQEVPGLGVR